MPLAVCQAMTNNHLQGSSKRPSPAASPPRVITASPFAEGFPRPSVGPYTGACKKIALKPAPLRQLQTRKRKTRPKRKEPRRRTAAVLKVGALEGGSAPWLAIRIKSGDRGPSASNATTRTAAAGSNFF